mgnify:CR=1 FL=1
MEKLVLIGVEELESIIDKSISKHFNTAEAITATPENIVLHSIKELADFLSCSQVTAQKLKNSGKIPFKQYGRKIQFDSALVLAAIDKDKLNSRKK